MMVSPEITLKFISNYISLKILKMGIKFYKKKKHLILNYKHFEEFPSNTPNLEWR